MSLDAMATRFELVMHGPDASRLRSAGEEAFSEIERIDRQLSAFDPESDISWINARAGSEAVKVDPRLFALLRQALDLYERTDRAFDITIGPLMKAWGLAGGEGRVPSSLELQAAMAMVGAEKLVLDESSFTVRFASEGMRIDLGAIGKGYAIEQAIKLLVEDGVTSAILHGGTSSVHAIGSPPDSDSWKVAIRSPYTGGESRHENAQIRDILCLRDSSVSVSAVHGRSFMDNGTEYGHVIDPRSGMPVQEILQAAVTGPSATTCDALSTALLVLGEEWLPILSVRFPGYEGFVVPR